MNATGRLVIRPEACRGCRSCQLACSFTRHGEYSPSRSCIELERDLGTEKTSPLVRMLCCDLCGGAPACADACAYGAINFEPAEGFVVEYRGGAHGAVE